MVYMAYQMLWIGDYEPIFRYLAISVLRSFCGWFTYLPPDPGYLMSNYDFPDLMQCMTIKKCGDPALEPINPFVSFFSGHVATLLVAANHMYLHGHVRWSIFFHCFDVFQIWRLLATRGHYSIDIIIGYFVAVYMTNPAGRVGRHFSRDRSSDSIEAAMPQSGMEAFEMVIGVNGIRDDQRASIIMRESIVRKLMKDKKMFEAMVDDDDFDYDADRAGILQPTARAAAERAEATVNQMLQEYSDSFEKLATKKEN